jgi:hypothetical protein
MACNVLSYYSTSSYQRALTDCHTAKNNCSRTDGSPPADTRRHYLPIFFCLHFAIRGGRSWIWIIDEANVVPYKAVVLYRHAFANKRMRADLASRANRRILLDLNEWADLGPLTDRATIQIDEVADPNIATDLYIRANSLQHGRFKRRRHWLRRSLDQRNPSAIITSVS